MQIPETAIKTVNQDGSVSYTWDDKEGSHTFTENLPKVIVYMSQLFKGSKNV